MAYGVSSPMLARRVMMVRARNTNPSMRLRWDMPSIKIAKNELTRERRPMTNARALGSKGLNSSDSHAMMAERSTMAEMR